MIRAAVDDVIAGIDAVSGESKDNIPSYSPTPQARFADRKAQYATLHAGRTAAVDDDLVIIDATSHSFPTAID